ncbi:MAG: CTP synthase [Clostridia bacterium]|nr:CTP synthase [Eubacteriales bacterium]MDD3866162.1 CTP synthase [Eubacteriales bacterium]MDD4461320.1 CTP synthase [Eubacteriales bacterium]NCC47644.1 CTP synthase [Clostridia bacterium]
MSTKYIFVTGGVVSGIGKGITAASLGCLLKARGLTVRNQKFDPYINIDPGMMSPIQHGEVFITEDGAETDLDIGHYERFTDVSLDIESDITSGMVYRNVINRERCGGYMGTTVQVVPHIINEIKSHVFHVARHDRPDVVIIEIGGTVGDMESLPFLEAIRQIAYQVGHENVLFMHVTLIPYLRMAGEVKTKPTQHSVQKLLSLGIQPDVLICRSEVPLDQSVRQKIALYCNVNLDCVIPNVDVDTVYRLPLMLEEAGLADVVCRKLGIAQFVEPDLRRWQQLVSRFKAVNQTVNIALVGKYVSLHDAYLSVVEALTHAGIDLGTDINIDWVSAEDIEDDGPEPHLAGKDAILVPGGFGPRGMAGMMQAAEYAQSNMIPFLGIGLGMQMAVVAFARSSADLADAHSTEAEVTCRPLFILPELPISEQNGVSEEGIGLKPEEKPMRRGACDSVLAQDSLLRQIYQADQISERHHHRWEFNPAYREVLAEKGLVFSGVSDDQSLVDAVELSDHPFFVGVIYHPEFRSRPIRPHPLFHAYLRAALQQQKSGQQS